MTSQNIINFEHVECMKITSDTTIYVRFTSGVGEVIEFKNSEQVNDIVKSFFDWAKYGSHKLYLIDKELK
jgi:uncharacterized protein YlzI (FlbEa/FlbD family)